MHKNLFAAVLMSGLLCLMPASHASPPAAGKSAQSAQSAQAAQEIPPELARLKQRYEAVMAKKDLDALAHMIAPGFLHNGRDKEGMLDNFRWFTPMINAYQMQIDAFRRDGALLVVDYKIHTDLATTEHSVPFKMIDGELHFYGNQRPLNSDGSLGQARKN